MPVRFAKMTDFIEVLLGGSIAIATVEQRTTPVERAAGLFPSPWGLVKRLGFLQSPENSSSVVGPGVSYYYYITRSFSHVQKLLEKEKESSRLAIRWAEASLGLVEGG